jgi:plasmid stability protein
MATLLVRDLPDDLLERFKRLAKQHHRSVPAEAVALIEQAVREEERREERQAALARLAERRAHIPLAAPGTPDSLTLLREDRDR